MTTAVTPSRRQASPVEWIIMAVASALLLILVSYQGWPLEMTEALGFVTGGICVWLVVREDPVNWPVGLANNLFFFALFLQARLYADMTLQLVYLVLGLYGWWNWLRGGVHHGTLEISRTRAWEWLGLILLIPLGTWGLTEFLVTVKDAAPFPDALTTVLSLAAQTLLCWKRLENWFFWIAADVVYIPLYLSKDLPLTAILYLLFLVLCLIGMTQWHRHWKRGIRP